MVQAVIATSCGLMEPERGNPSEEEAQDWRPCKGSKQVPCTSTP